MRRGLLGRDPMKRPEEAQGLLEMQGTIPLRLDGGYLVIIILC